MTTTINTGELGVAVRAQAYRWLAGIFAREPEPAALRRLAGAEGRDFLALLGSDPALAEGTAAMARVLAERPPAQDDALDLAAAYARLFLGAGGRQAVPPYESYYASGRLCHEATGAMEALLATADLAVTDFAEPPDHAAVELEFMAQLLELGRAAPLAPARFLDTHLAAWLPTFCRDVAQHDRSGYYAAAAGILAGMLESERRRSA